MFGVSVWDQWGMCDRESAQTPAPEEFEPPSTPSKKSFKTE